MGWDTKGRAYHIRKAGEYVMHRCAQLSLHLELSIDQTRLTKATTSRVGNGDTIGRVEI